MLREPITRLEVTAIVRWLILIVLLAVTACAPRPTLQELEQEAVVTGDWSKVHRREEKLRKRLQASLPKCPDGLVKGCVEDGVRTECFCVHPFGR